MTNQEEIKAVIQGHANRGDIYNWDEGEEFAKSEITLRALQDYGNDLILTLIDSLSDSDEAVREVVMRLLWEMDTDDEFALPAMIGALKDSNKSVRHGAAGFVARFGERAKAAIPILQSWIGGEDRYSHVTAIGAIIWIDKSHADALIPLLIDALEFDGLEQWQAIIQLESLGEIAGDSVSTLKQLLHDDDSNVRLAAGDAILEITGDVSDSVRVGLGLLEQQEDWLQRYVGAEHLQSLGPKARWAIPRLQRAARDDGNEMVRNRARGESPLPIR